MAYIALTDPDSNSDPHSILVVSSYELESESDSV